MKILKCYSVEARCNGETMEELIPEIVWEIKHRDKKLPVYRKLVKRAEAIKDYDSEKATDIFEELLETMDNLAPPYFFFGPVEGGYNFQLDKDSLEMAIEDKEVLSIGDDWDMVHKKYRGLILHTSDHGNMTLYYRNSKGIDNEIWGIV
jgi:hypothetical protein